MFGVTDSHPPPESESRVLSHFFFEVPSANVTVLAAEWLVGAKSLPESAFFLVASAKARQSVLAVLRVRADAQDPAWLYEIRKLPIAGPQSVPADILNRCQHPSPDHIRCLCEVGEVVRKVIWSGSLPSSEKC